MSEYTVIVPDNGLLQRICGTNDSNLKLIEAFLGTPVFAYGNEISVEAERAEVAEQFRFIVNRILDEIADSGSALTDTDIVRSVLNLGKNQYTKSAYTSKADFLKEQSAIVVPGAVRRIYPRTVGQAELVHIMQACDLVFAVGPAGCGKTLIAVAEALRLVLSRQKRSLVLTRPVVEAGESLGFLPGDLEEKINPYMRPLYDAMNSILPHETVRKMVESGVIEVSPLAYMRGRTLSESVVILDEAQNATKEQMKMFLTRMGEGSKVFVTGDVTQIDLPKRVPSGLLDAIHVLSNVQGVAIKQLGAEDVVRSALVRRIIQAYNNEN